MLHITSVFTSPDDVAQCSDINEQLVSHTITKQCKTLNYQSTNMQYKSQPSFMKDYSK